MDEARTSSGQRKTGVPNGIRTRVAALKARCPRPTRRWGRLQSNTEIGYPVAPTSLHCCASALYHQKLNTTQAAWEISRDLKARPGAKTSSHYCGPPRLWEPGRHPAGCEPRGRSDRNRRGGAEKHAFRRQPRRLARTPRVHGNYRDAGNRSVPAFAGDNGTSGIAPFHTCRDASVTRWTSSSEYWV